jgi:Fic family protein
MKPVEFQILPIELLEAYKEIISIELLSSYEQLQESELSLDTFSFYTSVSAVFSSKIEGEQIELDSYIKHKRFGIEFLPDYTRKIDDLYNAYQFAKTAACNNVNVTKAHQILTQNILPAGRQGKIRAGNMYVTTPDGKIEYVAAAPGTVNKELGKFYADLEILQAADLSLYEVFFFAAMLHLVFVKIHPFDDGNGRTARLIEKWFLANKLGEKAWLIQSEKKYYQQHQTYYKNLRLLGLEYELLDYNKALSFLTMLPKALAI